MDKFQLKKLEAPFRITDLVNASYYELPGGYEFTGESHDFWELSYVDRGELVLRVEDKSYLMKAGEMMLCKPNVFHSCRSWQGKPASEIDIAFRVEGTLMEMLENQIMILSGEAKQCMAAIIREAAQTYAHFHNQPAAVHLEKLETAPYGSEQIIRNRLEEMMIYACRSGNNIHIETRLIRAAAARADMSLSESVLAYMEANYARHLTLQDIAQVHSVSVTQLKRGFRAETGSTVIDSLTQLRIQEAKRMVRQGGSSFSQIAESVGYSSIHYFSALFKKQTGMTLTEYARSVAK